MTRKKLPASAPNSHRSRQDVANSAGEDETAFTHKTLLVKHATIQHGEGTIVVENLDLEAFVHTVFDLALPVMLRHRAVRDRRDADWGGLRVQLSERLFSSVAPGTQPPTQPQMPVQPQPPMPGMPTGR